MGPGKGRRLEVCVSEQGRSFPRAVSRVAACVAAFVAAFVAARGRREPARGGGRPHCPRSAWRLLPPAARRAAVQRREERGL